MSHIHKTRNRLLNYFGLTVIVVFGVISTLGTGLTAGISDTSCTINTADNAVTAVVVGSQPIISSPTPIAADTTIIVGNAAVSNITPAHNDYSDTMTFFATGTF